jgi:hypothetical protein
MTIQSTAGSTISIGAAPATVDLAGFAAVSYTAVGEVNDLGEFSLATYTEIKASSVGNRRTRKLKGSYENGTMSLKMNLDSGDAGQTAMKTALSSDADHSIKIVLQDGSVYYFSAKVMSFKVSLGSVDNITMASTDLGINSDVFEA